MRLPKIATANNVANMNRPAEKPRKYTELAAQQPPPVAVQRAQDHEPADVQVGPWAAIHTPQPARTRASVAYRRGVDAHAGDLTAAQAAERGAAKQPPPWIAQAVTRQLGARRRNLWPQ